MQETIFVCSSVDPWKHMAPGQRRWSRNYQVVGDWRAGSEHDRPFRHELVNINNMFRNTRSSVRGLV